MTKPLEGLLVVSIDQAVAAPYAASRLADAGARVIKIERPGGDFARGYDKFAGGESAYFVWLNRGKESVELNLKIPDDLALLKTMISRADVFMQNLAPGAAQRAGLGSATLREDNPRLITCDFSGYGSEGPYSRKKAYDLLIQAESGLASITGTPEAPGRVGISIVDVATGMYAYTGILEALIARGITGKGTSLQISLFDAVADWMTVPYLQQTGTGQPPDRIGIAHPSICPYGAFDTADGRRIVIAVQNEREWQRLCQSILERPELADNPQFAGNENRCKRRGEVDSLVAEAVARLAFAEVTSRLDAADIAYGALSTVAEFAAHPHLRTIEIDTPRGKVRYPAPPVQRDDASADRLGAVPALGEHTEKLRREFAPD